VEREGPGDHATEARLAAHDRDGRAAARPAAHLPRESEWVFTTLRGTHYTPSARTFHWNRVRCTIGLGDVSLYLATRHLYGWYALNVLDLPRTSSRCNQGTTTAGGSCESSTAPRRGDRAPAHARRVPRSRARDGAPERRETRPRAKRGVERNRVYLPRSAADRREQPDACGAH